MELMALLGVLALLVGLIFYNCMSWGYICLKFWGWFMIPIFPHLPQITYWQAVGLMLFINLFHNHSTEGIKDEFKTEAWSRTLSSIMMPWFVFGCAVLIKQAI